MPVHNADVAAIFTEIADLLELEQANPFRVRAYRSAARVIDDLDHDVVTMVNEGADLTELPGVGEDLAGKICEIVTTGQSRLLCQLREATPPALTHLLAVPGLGPKRVQTLHRDLHIRTLEQLARAARTGRIHQLPGFGEKTEQNILQAIIARSGEAGRMLLSVAGQYAEPLADHLRLSAGAKQVVLGGSYRRRKETVGDIDILVTASPREPVLDQLIRKAMDHPHFHILAHPTGRLLLKREPYDVDLEQILGHAQARLLPGAQCTPGAAGPGRSRLPHGKGCGSAREHQLRCSHNS